VGIVETIAKKRDGMELTAEEIGQAISAFMSGGVSDAQMAALLMAIYLRGMTDRECSDLTMAMLASGERLDLSAIPGTKVDKHSTGGVGDKTTLVVAPLVASFGVPVPKMSGRALGHTGGTIDKLEAIPGLQTDLPPDRFARQVADIGIAIAAQTAAMAPADKRIYALRDATATVESIPLIASSVMSKKLAAGADAIVLDVKAGRGAFMADVDQAAALAHVMVDIGRRAGKRMVALVTRMDEPLGVAVGDGPELVEAIETLAGSGPADFVELCEVVAGHMLCLGAAARDAEEGRKRAREGLSSGRGLSKLREMIAAQGGDPQFVDRPASILEGASRQQVRLEAGGYVTGIDARRVGAAVRELKAAAGRFRRICGVLVHAKTGDRVSEAPAATVLGPPGEPELVGWAAREVAAAFQVGAAPGRPGPLVGAVVSE